MHPFFKKLSWEHYLLVAVILLLVISQLSVFTQFKHLPSPIYGGDHYRNRGFLMNLVDGNPFYSDAFFINELNYYPWLGTTLYFVIMKVLGMTSVDNFMIYFSIVFTIAYAIILYVLGTALLGNKRYGLLFSILGSVSIFLLTGPATLTFSVLVPLSILFFYKIFASKEHKLRNIIVAAILFGLVGLTYGGSFAYLAINFGLIICMFFIYEFFQNTKSKNAWKARWALIKSYLLRFASFYIIGLIIFGIFYIPLLLRYTKIYNNVLEYGDVGVEHFTPGRVISLYTSQFFNFSNLLVFLMGILAFFGLIYLILSFKKSVSSRFLIFWIIAIPLGVLHHYISRPLLGTWFNPTHLSETFFLFPLLTIFGLKLLIDLGGQFVAKNQKSKHILSWSLLSLFFVLVCIFAVYQYNRYNNDMWVQYGKSWDTSTQLIYAQGDWFQKNLNNNDVVLSFDESGFMITALSGRKVMIPRRTHASYYININERIADAAVIMYGHDLAKTKALIKKYGLTYFYIDQYLLSSPFRTLPEYKPYLDSYNITSFEARERFDPANAEAKVYDLLFVPPQNFSDTFTSLLEPAQGFRIGNQTVAVVYRFKSIN